MIELGRTEEVCREMTNWRTRITHTTLLQEKLVCTAKIGGSVRILLVPTRCPQGIELISKKYCLTSVASRIKRIRLVTKIGGKALPHLGGIGVEGIDPAPHIHEDHIAGKVENSLQHYNLVHKFIPMCSSVMLLCVKVYEMS